VSLKLSQTFNFLYPIFIDLINLVHVFLQVGLGSRIVSPYFPELISNLSSFSLLYFKYPVIESQVIVHVSFDRILRLPEVKERRFVHRRNNWGMAFKT
jgi:hypothetical protein